MSTLEIRNNNKNETLNIAHRGARSIAPENTLSAAIQAYRSGADMWELDTQTTKDGRLVVLHDENLIRTTNVKDVYPDRGDYQVDSFTLSELKRLDAGSWFPSSDPFGEAEKGNITKSELKSFEGERVPTLREALELTSKLDWFVNVEVKYYDNGGSLKKERNGKRLLAERIISLVNELDMERRVLLSSFDHSLVKCARELAEDISVAILVDQPEEGVVDRMKNNKLTHYHLSKKSLQKAQGIKNINKLKAANLCFKVNLWTVNELATLKRLVGKSYIDGILTDYPQKLSSVLK